MAGQSLLIVDTKKDCVNCTLCRRDDLDRFVCQPKGKVVPVKGKPKFCPLQEMPELMNEASADFNLGWNFCLIGLEGLEDD